MLTKAQKKQVMEMYADWVKRGKKLTTYFCNHCKYFIVTNQPAKNDVGSKGYWDSATECLNCGKLNFVVTYPNGKTLSKALPA